MMVVYFLIKFLGGDKPLRRLNGWVDGYEAWLEERYESALYLMQRSMRSI